MTGEKLFVYVVVVVDVVMSHNLIATVSRPECLCAQYTQQSHNFVGDGM